MDNYHRRITEIEVLDGDTIRGVIDLGFGMEKRKVGRKKKPTFRILGIDCPETTRRGSWDKGLEPAVVDKCIEVGIKAMAFVQHALTNATTNGGCVWVHAPDWDVDSLGRILAYAYYRPHGASLDISVGQELLERHLAIVYDPKSRPPDFTPLLAHHFKD